LADQLSGHRAISTEYKAYHERRTLEARQDAANQEVKAINSRVRAASKNAPSNDYKLGKKEHVTPVTAYGQYMAAFGRLAPGRKSTVVSAPAPTDSPKLPPVPASVEKESVDWDLSSLGDMDHVSMLMEQVQSNKDAPIEGPNRLSWADEVQEEADAKEKEKAHQATLEAASKKKVPQPAIAEAETDKSRKPPQAGPKKIVPKKADRREAGPARQWPAPAVPGPAPPPAPAPRKMVFPNAEATKRLQDGIKRNKEILLAPHQQASDSKKAEALQRKIDSADKKSFAIVPNVKKMPLHQRREALLCVLGDPNPLPDQGPLEIAMPDNQFLLDRILGPDGTILGRFRRGLLNKGRGVTIWVHKTTLAGGVNTYSLIVGLSQPCTNMSDHGCRAVRLWLDILEWLIGPHRNMAIGRGVDQLTRISGETVDKRFARIKGALEATKMTEKQVQEKRKADLALEIDVLAKDLFRNHGKKPELVLGRLNELGIFWGKTYPVDFVQAQIAAAITRHGPGADKEEPSKTTPAPRGA
jgi:hypothetical protein